MTSMREKIARVLAVRDGMHPEAVSNDEDQVPAWTLYLDDADAVLDALMEPTKEMIVGGNSAIDEHIDFWNYDSGSGYAVESAAAVACLQAMILAAKEGK